MSSKFISNKKITKKFQKADYVKSGRFFKLDIEPLGDGELKETSQKQLKITGKIKVFSILENIYIKNQKYAFGCIYEKPLNNNLLSLVANPSLLMVLYKKIEKDKDVIPKVFGMANQNSSEFKRERKICLKKTCSNRLNESFINLVSKLIKENKYPWGASRRIYVKKPSKLRAERPILMPSFIDKVVQEALLTVMESVYEPYFEKLNCSFSCRPNKGVHDAILALTSRGLKGLSLALEGSIRFTYDKLIQRKLIESLNEEIKDRKFLKFIQKRLEYESFLPTGGRDLLYLFNIYVMTFDKYLYNLFNNITKDFNSKFVGKVRADFKENIISKLKEETTLKKQITTLQKLNNWLKQNRREEDLIHKLELISKMTLEGFVIKREVFSLNYIYDNIGIGTVEHTREILFNIKKYLNRLRFELYVLSLTRKKKVKLSFIYVRYAYSWIVLTNIKKDLLEKVETDVGSFLIGKLGSTVSGEKEVITDLKEKPAQFLGYEIITSRNNKRLSMKPITRLGSRIFALPDRQRLFDRFHKKGYCYESGFSKEMRFLSSFNDFSIIEKYNSVLRGLSLFYTEFIKSPSRNLNRWFYIIRYSCIKTLAHKHKMSVKKIFKKYVASIPKESKSKEKTIEISEIKEIGQNYYNKKVRLLTRYELIYQSFLLRRKKKVFNIYWNLNKGNPIIYNDKEIILS